MVERARASGPRRKYTPVEVRTTVWPWLKERGYVDDGDDPVLELFLNRQLGNRPAYLRPGLRLKGRWEHQEVAAVGGLVGLLPLIRADVNAILAAAAEPPLPVGAKRAETPVEDADRGPVATGGVETGPVVDVASEGSALRISRREPIAERVRHEVWRRDQGRCVDCGSGDRLEFDHIIPISKGGSNTARNLERRCEACNRRKAAHI
jgi:HNH endonuclease